MLKANFKRTLFNVIIFSLLSLILVACGSNSNGSTAEEASAEPAESGGDETITLRLGHQANVGVTYYYAAEGFAEEIEERTDGRIKVEVYPAAQLGHEMQMVQEVQQGSLDMVMTSNGPMPSFSEDFAVFHLPFLFEDLDHVYSSLEGELGRLLNEKFEEEGFKNLGFIGNGFKSISNSERPILSADDLKGLKIRTQENPVAIEVFRALGADPTPIPAPETYTALQQGVVNAFDGDIPSHDNFRILEVTDHISEVEMNFSVTFFLMNKDLFDSFDQETQELFLELGEKYAQVGTEKSEEAVEAYFQEAAEAGLEVVRKDDGKIDFDSFKAAVQPVLEQYSQFEKYIQAIEK